MERRQAFLMVLAASFLALLIYLTAIPKKTSEEEFPLKAFSRDVAIILTGDVMLGRTVMTKSLDSGEPTYPFKKVAGQLAEADFVFVNLENPIIENCPRTSTGLKFCADPKLTSGLKLAGVNVVTLANNHAGDYGKGGMEKTVEFLEEAGIEAAGRGNLVIKEKKGIKFGFLGFNFVSSGPKDEDFKLVSDSDKKVEVLIVGVHWGEEYKDRASKLQREWAKKLVEAGADVIVGHHSHWVQDSESIEGKPVYYSLGNFVFDQMWSQKTRQGLSLKLTYRNGQLVKIEELPIYMSSWAQP
ncbi:CapA family protein, partial [Candidatus Woesebacteria bacterium]|nr:CapA family protein [Candidatus Woesebacteria bacterium]